MRTLLAAAMAIALTVPAVAADVAQTPETVLVEGRALVGVWKISTPNEISTDLVHKAQFGAMEDRFCRIDQVRDGLAVRCFAPHLYSGAGTVSVDGAKVHLAWGVALARIVIDAMLQSSSRFDGTFAFKLTGIEYDDPEASTGTKLTLSNAAPDAAGKTGLLTRILEELANGALTKPHDAAAMKRNAEDTKLPSPDELRTLGGVHAVIYVGQTRKWNDGKRIDFFSVYDVAFANGDRLCGLHQRDDGVLDGFVCA